MSAVVLFDAFYMPVSQISLEHAVYLLVSGKAEPFYAEDGLRPVARLGLAASASENWGSRFPELIVDGAFLVPAGIRLHRAIAYRHQYRRPTRHLIFKRDRNRCQYCGRTATLTLDHVMPASRGGQNTWENLVSACAPCNQAKGARTPEEAKMPLKSQPKKYVPTVFFDAMGLMGGM